MDWRIGGINAVKLKYWAVGLAGLLFSAYLFYAINEEDLSSRETTLEAAKAKALIKLRAELDKQAVVLESMEVFYRNRDQVSQGAFMELITPFINDLNGVVLFGWLSASDDPDSTASMFLDNPEYRGHLGEPFRLLRNTDRLADNFDLLQQLQENAAPDEKGVGWNIRATLSRAINSGKLVVSEPLELDNDYGPGTVILEAIAVRSASGRLKGVSYALFDMDGMLGKTLFYELPLLAMRIEDADRPEPALFGFSAVSPEYPKGTDRLNVTVENQDWRVVLGPKENLANYPRSSESYFAFLLGLSSTFLLIVVMRERDNHQAELDLEVRKRTRELEESNKIKETLLREIHHRVKNNLQIASSLINLQKRRFKDPTVLEALSGSQSRISAIALIHKRIYEHAETKAVDLGKYLADLIKYYKRISPRIDFHIECPSIILNLDMAVPVALIISEIFNNSLKHAFPEAQEDGQMSIRVSLSEADQIRLVVSDNGRGLPEGFNPKDSNGIGFEIIRKLSRQLMATYNFESSQAGTCIELVFKNRGA